MDKLSISASIIGGMGDIIFGLQGFKEIYQSMHINTKCYLATHATEGVSLVRSNPYIATIKTINFMQDLSHFRQLQDLVRNDANYLGDANNFCYTINPSIHIPDKAYRRALSIEKSIKTNNEWSPIIILHPCGSRFSRYFLGEVRKVSTKELDITVWQTIIKELWEIFIDPYIILMGSKDDYETLSTIVGGTNLAHVYAGSFSILESIAMIQKSNMVIGVDSFVKSISLASKIPTVVFVNDHDDQFRDDTFLIPYKETSYALIIHNANRMSAANMISTIVPFIENFWTNKK